MRQPFAKGLVRGGIVANMAIASKGRLPKKDIPTHKDTEVSLLTTGRAESYPAPDGKLTFARKYAVGPGRFMQVGTGIVTLP